MSTAAKLTKKQLKAEQYRKKKSSEGVGEGSSQTAQQKKGKGRSPRSIAKERKLEKAKEELRKKADNGGKEVEEVKAALEKVTSAEKLAAKEAKKEKKRKRALEKEGTEGKQEEKADASDKKKTKRKRDEAEADPVKKTKKRFTEDGQVEEIEVEQTVAPAKAEEEEEEKKDDRRFIVFVGNMSFQSTTDEIAKHFLSHCGETPSVRLLTKKGDPQKLAELSKAKQKSIAKGKASDPSAPTSKGCAFLEFETASALQKALQFHHTQFQGRNINVELTAGGGGKGSERKEKIKKKNQDLEAERQKLHEKYVKGQKKDKKDEVKADEPKKEQLPAWGPRASASAKQQGTTKIPRWAASGSNAVRLSG